MSSNIHIPGYTVLRELGSGGMAVVYLATQDGLDRTVAVKVLRESLSGSGAEFKRRFEHEGRMLARLEHENIVKIHDIGATESAVYLVMEYLRGGTLTERMQAGGLRVEEVLKICAKVGLALHTAHQKNIIHRDLKPSNIMFRDSETPVLTDFGIARQIDMDLTLTETGMMIGTPQYMSPEQCRGRSVDARSDIYSLGLMLYRLLTGDIPFKATDPLALAIMQMQDEPPPLPDHLSDLQPVLDLMLAKEPGDRYATTLDFCSDLACNPLMEEGFTRELNTATRLYPSVKLKKSFISRGIVGRSARPGSPRFSGIKRSISTVFSQRGNRRGMRVFLIAALFIVTLGLFLKTTYFSHGLSEQEMARIERELRRFNGYMDTEQIVEPASRNATDTLQVLRQIAPDYGEIEDAAARLVNRYELIAYDHLDSGELETALDWADRGLEFAPEHDGMVELKNVVQVQLDERDRLARVKQLLEEGQNALAQGNLLPPGPGNAFDAFSTVRELDLQNEAAESGLSDIQQLIFSQVNVAWQRGERVKAQELVRTGLLHFADSSLLVEARSDIEQQLRDEREQQELDRHLVQSDRQFAEEKFAAPVSDNALESLQLAAQIRPEDAGVKIRLERLGNHFLLVARDQLEIGEFSASVAAAASGLDALPGNAALVEVQNEATSRMGEFDRQIQTLINRAEGQLLANILIPGQPTLEPGSETAYSLFSSVLELDPANAVALDGLASLPALIDSRASQLERAQDWSGARGLLLSAQIHYGGGMDYETRISSLDRQLATLATQQRLKSELEALDVLISTLPLTPEKVDQVAAKLRVISSEFPDEINVAQRLSRFINLVGSQAESMSLEGRDQEALAVLDHALLIYPSNEKLEAVLAAVRKHEEQRLEAEQQRLIAMSGSLSIDAVPWARVIEIRDSRQLSQVLPEITDTPLFLNLQEGDYTVVLETADGQTQKEMPIRITRQEFQSLRFDSAPLTASDYFERSGW